MDAPICQGCVALTQVVEQLRAEVAQLRADLATTQAKLAAAKKNSSNSSKPPSSDIVKPPRPRGKKKGKQGGQPGNCNGGKNEAAHPHADCGRQPVHPFACDGDAGDDDETRPGTHCPKQEDAKDG